MMRVIVAASRFSAPKTQEVEAELERLLAQASTGLVVIHGGTAGDEAAASAWAAGKRAIGLNVRSEEHPVLPADGPRNSLHAAAQRNARVMLQCPDVCITTASSAGVLDLIERCSNFRIPVRTI